MMNNIFAQFSLRRILRGTHEFVHVNELLQYTDTRRIVTASLDTVPVHEIRNRIDVCENISKLVKRVIIIIQLKQRCC